MEDEGKKSITIKEMDQNLRPREKAMKHGFQALSDAEIMAIIFATGTKGINVVDLCHNILESNMNHLSLVTQKSVQQLCNEHKGIGKVKALTLLAALELGRRASEDAARKIKSQAILSSQDAYERMRYRFQWLKHEEFWIIYLDRSGHVVREELISKGGTWATVVDVKLVMRSALDCLASALILYHNHPSGQLRPSSEDDSLTRRIGDAARLFDIRVNDHLIITDVGYYSFADHGRL